MFGFYRTFLALLVVAHHLLNLTIIGHYAVHGFFILSGYLMTFVMHNSYGYRIEGKIFFAINRILRLFPIYWFVLFLSILIIMYWGEESSSQYRQFIFLPNSFSAIFQNFSLIYLHWFPGSVSPRLSPPTWALTVELIFYFLIALGVSKTEKRTVIWLVFGVFYFTLTYLLNLDYAYRYSTVFAGSLPFSLGALIYHRRNQITKILKENPKLLNFYSLFGMLLVNAGIAMVAKNFSSSLLENLSLYLNYILNAFIVAYLINERPAVLTKKMDKIIGDFSYPIYLFHWQAGFAVSMLIWGKPLLNREVEGIVNFFAALILTFLVSVFAIKFIDGPIEKVRRKVKTLKRVKFLQS